MKYQRNCNWLHLHVTDPNSDIKTPKHIISNFYGVFCIWRLKSIISKSIGSFCILTDMNMFRSTEQDILYLSNSRL